MRKDRALLPVITVEEKANKIKHLLIRYSSVCSMD